MRPHGSNEKFKYLLIYFGDLVTGRKMFRLLRVVNSMLEGILFFCRNILACRKFDAIQVSESQGLILRGADVNDFERIEEIYKKLNGIGLSPWYKRLLRCCPLKLIIILEEEFQGRKHIIGIDLFYINSRDGKEKTVHEGFVGVMPEHEGRGIATKMRKHAIVHFSGTGSRGISTRISKNNHSSLRSAEKVGFQPVEEYFDPDLGEDRYYLICRFENSCDQ